MSEGLRGLLSRLAALRSSWDPFRVQAREGVPHRLLLFCHQRSATQEIHFLRPLRRPVVEGECQLVLTEERDLERMSPEKRSEAVRRFWAAYRPTVVVFSRYAGNDYAALLSAAAANDTPIVAHLDDDLFDVPDVIGPEKKAFHGAAERLQSLRAVFSAANVIYLPTTPLADRIRRYGFAGRIVVPPIQVAADADELCPPKRIGGKRVTVGYMGTSSHQRDLDLVVPAIRRLFDAHPDMRFETFGTIKMPAALSMFRARVASHSPAKTYDEFLVRLKAMDWQIGIAPLRPIEFNRFRTYTKWMEYTLAGVPVLASDLLPYRSVISRGGGILVKDGEWENKLGYAVTAPEEHLRFAGFAQEMIARDFSPERLATEILSLGRMSKPRRGADPA